MNAEELIILQYELMKQKGVEKKNALENYSKCLCKNDQNEICLGVLINEIRELSTFLDPDKFDNAVETRCCKHCQAGWASSKSIKTIKKRLAGIKQSMHALARQLLKDKSTQADSSPLGCSG
jgi:hypothetical protein